MSRNSNSSYEVLSCQNGQAWPDTILYTHQNSITHIHMWPSRIHRAMNIIKNATYRQGGPPIYNSFYHRSIETLACFISTATEWTTIFLLLLEDTTNLSTMLLA